VKRRGKVISKLLPAKPLTIRAAAASTSIRKGIGNS
ncbi:uncharacterized protein METZ01_LOCUS361022, partial [marine metagenome]